MRDFLLGFISAFILSAIVIVLWAQWEKRQERLDQEYMESFTKKSNGTIPLFTHTLADKFYNIDMSAKIALQLCAEGKIEYCPGKHDHTKPNERVYHCKTGYNVAWNIITDAEYEEKRHETLLS